MRSGPFPMPSWSARRTIPSSKGASYPDELVNRAVDLGLSALAITDDHSLAGIVKAHTAAKAVGLKLLIGARDRTTEDIPGPSRTRSIARAMDGSPAC